MIPFEQGGRAGAVGTLQGGRCGSVDTATTDSLGHASLLNHTGVWLRTGVVETIVSTDLQDGPHNRTRRLLVHGPPHEVREALVTWRFTQR
jgi:hypothetical protein